MLSFEPSIQDGKPFDVPVRDQREHPVWAILFPDGTWADSNSYQPETLSGIPYSAVLYKDSGRRTIMEWGSSWVGYFPDLLGGIDGTSPWISMNDRDLGFRSGRMGQSISCLLPGLMMGRTEWLDTFKIAQMHPELQEIAADFNPEHYEWEPTGEYVQNLPPDLGMRYEEHLRNKVSNRLRMRQLRQADIDTYLADAGEYWPGVDDEA